MLTPRFKLSQDENHIFITVHAPYTNIGDTEVDVDGENFLFVSSPYFLRLRLPGRIVDNEQSKGSYVCDSGDFNLTFDKEIAGEHFENLDMITSLLAPRDIPNINPDLVEALEEDGVTNEENEEETNGEDKKYGFGFANKISTEFVRIGMEFPQIFELKFPEKVEREARHDLRIDAETEKFSEDHYLADLYDTELIEPYLKFKPAWQEANFNKNAEFTEDEFMILKELPNKHYLLSKREFRQVLLGLADIMFGYCYDKRTTLNDSTVESSWTINKLSSTLSWFCTFDDEEDLMIACYRRALIYPIFRNFKICKKVHKDLVSLLKQGKKYLVKCLIEIHQMFNSSTDARYILNQLYIKDYLVFIQKCKDEKIDELSNNLANIELRKDDLDLDLDELEEAAEIVKNDEIIVNQVAHEMSQITIVPGVKKQFNAIQEEDEDSDTSSSDSSSSDLESEDSNLDSDDDPY